MCNGTYSIALLGNGIFYSISRDHKQLNKVLYNKIRRYNLIASAVYYVDKYEIACYSAIIVLYEAWFLGVAF
jgi:hypothetical protein